MDDSFKEPPLPAFSSIGDECSYWKGRYNEIKQKFLETKQEFADFEDNSRQLEAELETCLEQREKTIQDLKHSIDQLQTDNESLRVSTTVCIHFDCDELTVTFVFAQKKVSSVEFDYNTLENKHSELCHELDVLREHTRKVEQKNDDLERANRVVGATVSDLEAMLNQAYEKNEFLELEVEDKESLSEKHQRVLDELRGKRRTLVELTPFLNISHFNRS